MLRQAALGVSLVADRVAIGAALRAGVIGTDITRFMAQAVGAVAAHAGGNRPAGYIAQTGGVYALRGGNALPPETFLAAQGGRYPVLTRNLRQSC